MEDEQKKKNAMKRRMSFKNEQKGKIKNDIDYYSPDKAYQLMQENQPKNYIEKPKYMSALASTKKIKDESSIQRQCFQQRENEVSMKDIKACKPSSKLNKVK